MTALPAPRTTFTGIDTIPPTSEPVAPHEDKEKTAAIKIMFLI